MKYKGIVLTHTVRLQGPIRIQLQSAVVAICESGMEQNSLLPEHGHVGLNTDRGFIGQGEEGGDGHATAMDVNEGTQQHLQRFATEFSTGENRIGRNFGCIQKHE